MHTCKKFALLTLALVLVCSCLTGCFEFSFPSMGDRDPVAVQPPLFAPEDDQPVVPQDSQPAQVPSVNPTETIPLPTQPVETIPPVETEPEPTETQPKPTETEPEPTEPAFKPTGNVTGHGVVLATTLNVRSGPGTNYDVLTTLPQYSRVTFYAKDGNWIQVEQGWVSRDYVYTDGSVGPDGSKMGTVNGTDVNLRTGPGTGYGIKGQVNTGDRLEILFQAKFGGREWGCTAKGWICMDYVDLDN